MTTKDEKYITFDRAPFDAWQRKMAGGDIEDIPLPEPVGDAVVIRTKDVFAGPALHSYASNIWNVAEAYRFAGLVETADKLLPVADYFHERAVEADQIAAANTDPRYPT